MGLDMYLDRFDRYKHATPKDISAVEDWIRYQARDEKYKGTSFYDWCHEEKPSDDFIQFYSKRYKDRHPYWAFTDNYTYKSCGDNIGYWRKANQIHQWFVDNIQDGVDDCGWHREVTEQDLKSLLDTCQTVLNCSRLTDGDVTVYYTLNKDTGAFEPAQERGKVVENPLIAEELLPTTTGCFFGNTDYDEYYIEDIKETVKIIKSALQTTDFEKQMIYYCSSW